MTDEHTHTWGRWEVAVVTSTGIAWRRYCDCGSFEHRTSGTDDPPETGKEDPCQEPQPQG